MTKNDDSFYYFNVCVVGSFVRAVDRNGAVIFFNFSQLGSLYVNDCFVCVEQFLGEHVSVFYLAYTRSEVDANEQLFNLMQFLGGGNEHLQQLPVFSNPHFLTPTRENYEAGERILQEHLLSVKQPAPAPEPMHEPDPETESTAPNFMRNMYPKNYEGDDSEPAPSADLDDLSAMEAGLLDPLELLKKERENV